MIQPIRWFFIICTLATASCISVGPKRLHTDRFDYSEAISQSNKQQMLTNIVRMSYLDFPVFMSVGSVITSYEYTGDVGVQGTASLAEAVGGDSFSGNVNIAISERPTITYSPLSGREFTERLFTPLPVASIFALGQAGWDIEVLLRTGITRINNVENLSFEVDQFGDDSRRRQRDTENVQKFHRVIDLLWYLANEDIIELQSEGESRLPKLVLDAGDRLDISPLVIELKTLLDLDQDRNEFQVTTRMTQRRPNEITIQSRSLTSIMAFLSKGVDIPQAHILEGRTGSAIRRNKDNDKRDVPLRVRWQSDRPNDEYLAVRYQGYWFYIDQADIESKLVFQMLLALFELQAPAGGAASPLLTLPAGG
jgi:hypothetical protein